MKMDTLVERYIGLRDQKKEIVDAHKLRIAELDGTLDKIEAVLLKTFGETGIESVNTTAGTAYISSRTSATVADWDIFLAHVKANNAFELIERRCSKDAVAQYKAANEDLPPGVNWSEERTVNVRRPKR